jgi:hypothetical protein
MVITRFPANYHGDAELCDALAERRRRHVLGRRNDVFDVVNECDGGVQ